MYRYALPVEKHIPNINPDTAFPNAGHKLLFAYFRFEINKHITINYHHHFIKEKCF